MSRRCKKCGGDAAARPSPTYSFQSDADDDMRTAEVYFHHFVSITLDGHIKDFYPAEIIRLNFSLINSLQEIDSNCLSFRRKQEEVLYDAAF
jgi:hypothetical protein